MRKSKYQLLIMIFMLICGNMLAQNQIIHDAEYYIIEAQNGKKWAVEDGDLDKKLAELKKQYKTPPNIVHYMWDDQPPMSFGDRIYQKMRGYDTPELNKLAEEGMIFARMYTEPGCTPSRAAVLTGQNAVRTGTYEIGFPVEYSGFSKDNITIAEVLSKAGYNTGFFGKLHLGDVEESYLHNQGFDEALWAVYNQVTSLYNIQGEAANAVINLKPELLAPNPYQLDKNWINSKSFVFYLEGKKGEQAREWHDGSQEIKDYKEFDTESRKRALNFITRSVEEKKPFYVAWWPLMFSFMPNAQKTTLQRGLVGEEYQRVIEVDIAALRAKLEELGVAENTLIVAMADNGPMTHNPPPGAGLGEGMFTGGKGDFTEGGIRVCAAAVWPGVIAPDGVSGDMISITDLFTTFARIAGATKYIPTDRIIDGIDQTSLLFNGDTFGRRDYLFVYQGSKLAATIKDQFKIHWINKDPSQANSGLTSVIDLYNDHREVSPMVVKAFHMKEPFKRMKARHEAWTEKYPNREQKHGMSYTGISNARPETKALANPPVEMKNLPFDANGFVKYYEKYPHDPSGGVDKR